MMWNEVLTRAIKVREAARLLDTHTVVIHAAESAIRKGDGTERGCTYHVELRDMRDPQAILWCCPHNHKSGEAALKRCGQRGTVLKKLLAMIDEGRVSASPAVADTIKVKCPHCGKSKDDALRADYDPPHAVLMVVPCECTQGCKIDGGDYYDADGNWIDWFEWNQSLTSSEMRSAPLAAPNP